MKNDFRKMEDEMDLLATNMATITDFSGRISNTLQDRREQITKLSGVHMLLKKVISLEYVYEPLKEYVLVMEIYINIVCGTSLG